MTHILIIEDDPNLATTMASRLELEGFNVRVEPNGKAGLKAASESRPDLILCDIAMPEMDGYEVLASIREQESTSEVPFVFLTARVERNDVRKGMHQGADDYLCKPVTREDLMATAGLAQAALQLGHQVRVLAQLAQTADGDAVWQWVELGQLRIKDAVDHHNLRPGGFRQTQGGDGRFCHGCRFRHSEVDG